MRIVLAVAMAAFAGAAVAQDRWDGLIGDPEAGARLAAEACASCHAVEAGDLASPVGDATPFQVLADAPGMTERAINVWLTTFHPERTMPAIVLSTDEREDVIAYILSLGED